MTKALVLFSGGQDSTTCLYWAKKQFDSVEALNLSYGQRHEVEINSALRISELAKVTLHGHHISVLKQIGDSNLFNKKDVNDCHRSSALLPASFVPGRNILFLTIAGALAYKLGIKNIVTGVCQTDYSGYPDCRQETIKSIQKTISLGMDYDFKIYTPLMNLTKEQSVHLAKDLPGCWEALGISHTCYEGQNPPCEKCPACVLRAKGFKEAELTDPLLEN